MLNRLGFWNRLAFVAAAAVCLIFPWQYVLHNNTEVIKQETAWWFSCTSNNNGRPAEMVQDAWAECDAARDKAIARRSMGSDDWGIMLAGTAFACLLAWGFLWVLAAIGKWVWRGRTLQNTKTE